MFLEKIKINGFKSFARSLEIDFDSSLIAIVGPNGSGKSNIVDAVRWVLGEQSAKSLRGSKMADVIFAGSKGHQGRNKASVTLYINNEQQILPIDLKKIKIARTVNQDGQSDYFLNDSLCRLKDIENILMDTGIGKNSYSIVSQGQISSIINSRPEKLRELFEESAGISKHKSRKEETEKRLEKTNNDLQRIADLIAELDRQLPALEKEASRAEKYLRLYQHLKILETNMLYDNWSNSSKELTELSSDYSLFQKQLTDQQKSFTEFAEEFSLQKETLKEQKEKLDNYQKEYYKLSARKDETQNKLNILEEKKKSLLREKDEYRRQLQNLSEEKESLQEKKVLTEQKKAEIAAENSSLQEKLKEIDDAIQQESALLAEKKNILQEKRDKLLTDRAFDQTKSQQNRLAERIKNRQDSLEKLTRSAASILDRLKDEILQKKKLIMETGEINSLQHKETLLSKKYQKKGKQLAEDFNSQQKIFNKQQQKVRDLQGRLQLLEQMEKDYQGFYRGVRNLLKEKNKFSGLIGTVADIINVEKKLEQAVSAVLGSRLQNIVVDNDRTARNCIGFLKKDDYGQATFLPLNLVKGKKATLKSEILKEQGVLGTGSQLVEYSQQYSGIIDYLLGRTLFTTDLDTAVKVKKAYDCRMMMVTLAGETINPGGAMTGGSSRNKQQQLLERPREIKEIKDKLVEIQQEKEKQQEKLASKEEKMQQVRADLARAQQRLQKIKLEKNDLKNRLQTTQKNYQDLLENARERQTALTDMISGLKQDQAEFARLSEKLQQASSDFSRNKDIIAKESSALEKLEQQIEELKNKKTDLQIKRAAVRQQADDLNDILQDIKKACQENSQKQKSSVNRQEKISEELIELAGQKKDLANQLEKFTDDVIKNQEKYQQNREKTELLQEKVEKQEKILTERRNKLDRYRDDLHQLELKINQLENKKERSREKLLEEYQLDPEKDSITEKIKITNYRETASEIKQLKSKINSLGDVNTGAVNEYQELKNRVSYLKEQQADLNKARESLSKIIKEIEKKMGQLFFETYQKVKNEFELVFSQLFAGGQAELKLTDPADYLQTGVEIIAQPPGKQLKKLSLLSGGERALTAIALVFAFLKVNPSPLYILDEIDAPLDDANVIKFADFINQYSSIAQFILITHRKHMMTRAETIYGVTMEESGISRLVSLKLKGEEGVELATN